jgi:hypothetical protein
MPEALSVTWIVNVNGEPVVVMARPLRSRPSGSGPGARAAGLGEYRSSAAAREVTL